MPIRPLTLADGDAYRQIRLLGLRERPEAFSSSHEDELRFSRETFARRGAPDGDDVVLGAFGAGGALLGVAGRFREKGTKVRHKARVVGMYVHPEARGCGLGRALLEAVVAQARELEGLRQLHLGVSSTNAPARRLYRALGFRVYGLEPNALIVNGRALDEELMVLEL